MSGAARPAVVSSAELPLLGRNGDGPVAPLNGASGPWGATVIVGREAELVRLAALRDAAFAGRTTTVLIGGEAGVGKTSVTNAFVAATQRADPSVRVIRGECVPLGGEGLPYAPIVGLLHELADQIGEQELLDRAGAGSAELRSLVPEFGHPGESVDGLQPQNRLRLFETFARLIEDTARRTPVIVVIEDLHWADDSSRHVIEFLVRALADVPALVLLTYRTDELTRRHPLRPFLAEIGRVPSVRRIEIGPLGPTEVTELINIYSRDHDQDTGLITRVVRASGGIPYFAVELVRASRSATELPETLRDTLLLRISRVGEECQRLLRLMAVGGNRVEHDLIAAVSQLDVDQLEAILREATDANLLVPDSSGYAFRHALMREVLHDDLLPGELTRLHMAYVAALEARPDLMTESVRAVELAHHSYAARNNAGAFYWSVQAARLQCYGYAEALRHYERALELWQVVDNPEAAAGPLADFLDEAANAANDAGEVERSLAMINEALRIAGPDADPQATALRLARKARRMINLVQPGVLDLVEQAVRLVPAEPPTRFRAQLLDSRASMQLLLNKPASIASAREAIAAARAVGDRDIESSARNTLGCALATLGIDPDEGLAQLRLAGELAADDMTRLRYHINLSDTLTLLGRYQEAIAVAIDGRELAARVGRERHSGVMMAGNAAEAAIAMGDWRRAKELIEAGLRAKPSGNHWIHQRRLLATVTMWMDDDLDSTEAILHDLGCYTQIATTGPQYHVGIRVADAELALVRRDPERAWQIITDAVNEMPWSEPMQLLRGLGVAAIAYGQLRAEHPQQPDQAKETWLRERLNSRADIPAYAQVIPMIIAELDPSVDNWSDAIARMHTASAPPHRIAYGYLRLAELQASSRLRDEARRSADRSRELADRMGLRLMQRRLDEFADRTGVRPESDQVTADTPLAGLTTRELEVLGLVADGLSNRQIGERLVISVKTASVHVSNILAKLHVGSRAEAAARYRRAGS